MKKTIICLLLGVVILNIKVNSQTIIKYVDGFKYVILEDEFTNEKMIVTDELRISEANQNIGISYMKNMKGDILLHLSSIYPQRITYDLEKVEILLVNKMTLNIPILIPTKQVDYNNGVMITIPLEEEQLKILEENTIKGIRVLGLMSSVKNISNKRLEKKYGWLSAQLKHLINTKIE